MLTKIHKGTDIHVVWNLQLNYENVDYSVVQPELTIKGPKTYKKITTWTGSAGKIEFDYKATEQFECGVYEVIAVFWKGQTGQYTVDADIFQLVPDSNQATDPTLSSVSIGTLEIGTSADLTQNSLYLLWLQEGHTGTVSDFFQYMMGNPLKIKVNGNTTEAVNGEIDLGTIEAQIPEMSVVLNGTENKFVGGKVYLNVQEHPSTEINLIGKKYTSDENGTITIPDADLPWYGWAEY